MPKDRDATEMATGVPATYVPARNAIFLAYATSSRIAGQHLRVHTPLIDWPKTRIIQRGLALGVDYARTHSCYDPDTEGCPCRRCESTRSGD